MKPQSFDEKTSREMVGDERARKLEEKARKDAADDNYEPPKSESGSYWGQCQDEFALQVYTAQYRKTMERLERLAEIKRLSLPPSKKKETA